MRKYAILCPSARVEGIYEIVFTACPPTIHYSKALVALDVFLRDVCEFFHEHHPTFGSLHSSLVITRGDYRDLLDQALADAGLISGEISEHNDGLERVCAEFGLQSAAAAEQKDTRDAIWQHFVTTLSDSITRKLPLTCRS